MSKAEALTAWQRISPEERQLAIKAVPPFVAWCREKPDYRPIHACRFLAKKRYEGHLGLNGSSRPAAAPNWDERLDAFHVTGVWPEGYGPPPCAPDCRVPPDIIEAARRRREAMDAGP